MLQKHGLTEDEVLEAKITAVWKWIDYIEDGTIEPLEIYRIAQVRPTVFSTINSTVST